MIKRALLMLSLVGCGVPTPEGFPLANAGPAVDLALASMGITDGRQPTSVEGVNVGCHVDGNPGFINPDTGECVGGMHVAGQIWLVVGEGQTYDSRLCHELIHWLWGDRGHDRAALWAWPAGLEWTCKDALSARPEITTIVPAVSESR